MTGSAFHESTPFLLLSALGGVAFALSGFLAGVRKGLDVMGIFVLAFLAANGGGIMRDLLVGRPPAVLRGLLPFGLAAATVALAAAARLHHRAAVERHRIFVVSDAVGLAAFGVAGALVGVEHGLPPFGVIALSFLTATGGGLARDVLVNEVPLVLRADFYGSVALLVGLAVQLLDWADRLDPAALALVLVAGTALRLVAYARGWGLPRLS